MTGIKQVAAGLVALALLTTSAVASDMATAGPFAVVKGHEHGPAAGRWIGGLSHMPSSRIGEPEALPPDQPGGVCDHGDNAMIC